MDEIGLVVSHIDPAGFARFQMIGGLNPQTLVGHRARFANGIRAVIGIEDQEDWTKRATLAGVYSSTLLYWLNDRSPGGEATWGFLDRRIDDVMKIEKWKAEWRGSGRSLSLSRFLGRLRYPPR